MGLLERLACLDPRRKPRLELEHVRSEAAALAAERDEVLRQRDGALAERNAYLRQRDEALGERNEILRQRDDAIGERNEILRQRDGVLVERDRLLEQLTEADAARSSATVEATGGSAASQSASARGQGSAPPARQNTIVFAALPKSGTEFVWGGIRDATGLAAPPSLSDQAFITIYLSGYCNREDVHSTGLFTSERLNPKALASFMPEGYVLALHAAASYHNVRALRSAGIRRFSVLLRDPRDSTVSWTHHIRKLGMGMRNFNSGTQHVPLDYFDWPHARQLAFQVRTFLPAAVNWIESWLGAVAEGDGEPDIQIVYFDELRRDPRALLKRLFEFHGVTEFDLSRIRQPIVGDRHYRQGEHDSWREEFSAADRAFADSLIGDRLQVAFNRAAARHPDLAAAEAAESASNEIAAVHHLLSLLHRFGSYRPAWESLERMLAARGIVIEPWVPETNPFIIPASALKTLEARLNGLAPHDAMKRVKSPV